MIPWEEAFSQIDDLPSWSGDGVISRLVRLGSLVQLKAFLDVVHIKHCLLKPYAEHPNYPLVESRELLPSFEVDLYEYKELPGFSVVAFERPVDSFSEIFQFDRLYNIMDLPEMGTSNKACPLVTSVVAQNVQTFRSRLPRRHHDAFLERFAGKDISYLENYPAMIPSLLELERAHVLSLDANGEFYLSGIYGSLPSDLDAEIKRYGLKIGKFRPGDNCLYERNRLFVYQFLMELCGFPIVSERRTSAALFARRLFRSGEAFLVRVQGQSDRTITTMYSHARAKHFPRVEKTALVAVDKHQQEARKKLAKGGWFVDKDKKVVIIRVTYRQHKFNALNVRQDRALSVLRQEIIHPITGETRRDINLIKDTSNMVLKLTDIVRGEHSGSITYKRQEIVQDTDTHEKRLKFLYFWLSKHQRRIIGYSDEFYAQVVKVLDSYLLSPDNFDTFSELHDLYQEVWAKYSFIQQARKVGMLEDLLGREYKGKKLSYKDMLGTSADILNDLKYELVNYFGDLVDQALAIGERMLADRYLVRTYIDKKDDDLSGYGRDTKKNYRRLVAVLDDFRSIRRTRGEEPPATPPQVSSQPEDARAEPPGP